MCHFVSWIEDGYKIYFLTGKDVFESERGKELIAYLKLDHPNESWHDDLIGHGAIRWFYHLDAREGTNKECTDFTSPANFPPVIAEAIKRGDMTGFNIAVPVGLLLKTLDDKYWVDRKTLYDKYQADRKTLYDKYQADRKTLGDKYQADLKTLGDKYQADLKTLGDKYWVDLKTLGDQYWVDLKTLDDKYWADLKTLGDKYQADLKTLGDKYWALFADPANRAKAWR